MELYDIDKEIQKGKTSRYNREYYKKNIKRLREKHRQWSNDNRDKYKEYYKKWYEKNKITRKQYYMLHKDEISKQRKEKYQRDKEKMKEMEIILESTKKELNKLKKEIGRD